MGELRPAPPATVGREDTFSYEIGEACVSCGSCARTCPAGAIASGEGRYRIDADACIDCGTCSYVCPVGAARSVPLVRESISPADIDLEKCYFNPGCALSLYEPEVAEGMYSLLAEHMEGVRPHRICCRHDPGVEAGSTIINNCAGCDRRFRSLYEGVSTISFWEVADSIDGLELPGYGGLTVSVHDSCGYRHKPQVHRAVRSLLAKMGIQIREAELSGTESACCGDSLYGLVPDDAVEERIRQRAAQLPCDDVVVYCIGCVRAMQFAGKRAHYLPDLLLGRRTELMGDTLGEYHAKLGSYIDAH